MTTAVLEQRIAQHAPSLDLDVDSMPVVLIGRELCQKLLRVTRTMSPLETALFIREHTGWRPTLIVDGHGPGYAVRSLRRYPGEHIVRPTRDGGYRCPCEARTPDCRHVEDCRLHDAEVGRPVEFDRYAA